eukprot:TRINITY_DN1980_c0_g1_i2.p1 TRINITY_DN1980_c0_g1~~TRINITY_DN1980_c0_g1_i2.p1  ORF type:complete len:504 (-),score=97.92 TRINITY_DN1980_c0_g1_i2:437-1948(-)
MIRLQIFKLSSSKRCYSFKAHRAKEIDKTVLSVFDMFSIGIGPSSSHTVGPMRASNLFIKRLLHKDLFEKVTTVRTDLYGSLALTGEGHGTPKAILLGLEGNLPETVDPNLVNEKVADIRTKKRLNLGGTKIVRFENDHLRLLKSELLPHHSNGIRFTAFGPNGEVIDSQDYYSIGGGFVVDAEEIANPNQKQASRPTPPLMFHTGEELLNLCNANKLSISELQMENEIFFGKTRSQVEDGLMNIWNVMNACIERGLTSQEKLLPGGLGTKRRAPGIFKKLESMGSVEHDKLRKHEGGVKPTLLTPPVSKKLINLEPHAYVMDWISAYAMAVNEENAAGGRVVTAPTNGAAGVIPAVLRYWVKWGSGGKSTPKDIVDFMLTSAAIGMLFKKGASISAAEVGCQGEIGVASSMAAAGLCALYGGSPSQVENAAEIGMEHHLGLTCDLVGGLVQIPCIERNTMGSIKAVNSTRLARLAMMGDDNRVIALDTVIVTQSLILVLTCK